MAYQDATDVRIASMGKDEKTSKEIASLAARLLKNPKEATLSDIRSLSGAVLTQAPDKVPARPPKPKPRGK